MFRRVLAIAAGLALAVLAAWPSFAVPLGKSSMGGFEKSPAKAVEESTPSGQSWLQHAMPATSGDKAVLVDTGAVALIRDEDGGILIGKLYMVFIERDVEEVAAIAAVPQLCAIPQCQGVPENTIAEAADRARESIMRQRESGVGNFSASKQVREKDTAYRFEEIKEPADDSYGGGGSEPVAIMNAPRPPWWQDWVTPTTVIGLLGTIIAGFSAWYAVQHQRHQMQQEQLKLAAAASAPAAPLIASPIAEVSAPPKPRRSRARAASSPPPAAGSGRTRSQA
jgi:hypothetical protein